jgi:cytidyltransferase-like protein
MKIVLVSGGFDPLHSGHIAYFTAAKSLGNKLFVGVNSNAWLTRKKGRPFMPIEERATIVQSLSMVDAVVAFDDNYDSDNSCTKFIQDTLKNYPDSEIVFANGGDRTNANIPEMTIQNARLSFEFGVGGENKKNSSSWVLNEWKAPKTPRPWGYYRVLHEEPGVKVKELAVDPGQSLSVQRHFYRSEYWLTSEGTATVDFQRNSKWQTMIQGKTLERFEDIHIPVSTWHCLRNTTDQPVRIIEIQYGEDCREEDIERKTTNT